MKKVFFLIYFLFMSVLLFADVKLPNIFGNGMVLQRNKPIPIWGWADPGEKITALFDQQTKSAIADQEGHWKIYLDKEMAGGPYQLIIKGKTTVIYDDVLVGDVWICSGQSNMEFHVSSVVNASDEIANANYPQIRHIKIPNTTSIKPKDDIPAAEWKSCTSQNVGDFTAVGYFFARELYQQLHVPIGLINTSWGGTHVETWTSREAFEKSDEFKAMISTLPYVNLDSIAAAKTRMTLKRIESLQGTLDSSDIANSWKDESYDDSSWPKMTLPGLWEQQQLGELDGIVWFRKTIVLSAEDAGRLATLQLSMIDDADDSYINGVPVGSTNGYNLSRKYIVPAGILKEGNNVIAVRVLDTGGGGGIYGDSSDLKLSTGNHTISLTGPWSFRVAEILKTNMAVPPNSYPTLLFNAMVNPLIPYGIEGAIWYQGEANADRAYQYRKSFPLMITDWRNRWKEGNFPFYFVQLATYNAANGDSKKGSTWAEVREAQTKTLSLPNTGMSITTDIGNPADIHPTNKQDVGKRLAAIALHNNYGRKVMAGGPVYQNMKINGDMITLSFANAGSGLMAKGDELKGFEIAGEDKQFYPAKAIIKDNQVVVYNNAVSNPVAVRFGWADNAEADNLYNKEQFPAGPFRTDDWKGITDDKKYSIGQ